MPGKHLAKTQGIKPVPHPAISIFILLQVFNDLHLFFDTPIQNSRMFLLNAHMEMLLPVFFSAAQDSYICI